MEGDDLNCYSGAEAHSPGIETVSFVIPKKRQRLTLFGKKQVPCRGVLSQTRLIFPIPVLPSSPQVPSQKLRTRASFPRNRQKQNRGDQKQVKCRTPNPVPALGSNCTSSATITRLRLRINTGTDNVTRSPHVTRLPHAEVCPYEVPALNRPAGGPAGDRVPHLTRHFFILRYGLLTEKKT